MDVDLRGRVAVVTGASSGIGREMARGLARRGARVLTVSRRSGEGASVAEEIRTSTGNGAVTFVPADLSSIDEVRDLAERMRSAVPRIDLLANNAGAYFVKRVTTADGYEATFALNHLAPFLLTHLLLEPLLQSPNAHVVATSSAASSVGRLRLDDPMPSGRYNGWTAYAQSKLANIAFTVALARRLEGTPIRANAFHPGFVDSGFGEGTSVMNRLVRMSARRFARSPEAGADTGLYLATSLDVADVSGGYFADRHRRRPRAVALDPAVGDRLWEVSEALVHLSDRERGPLARTRSAA